VTKADHRLYAPLVVCFCKYTAAFSIPFKCSLAPDNAGWMNFAKWEERVYCQPTVTETRMPIDVSPLFADEPNDSAKPAPASTGPTTDAAASPNAVRVAAQLPSDDDISRLGADGRAAYGTVTNDLLSLHKSNDLGEMGSKLTELISTAKGLDPKQAGHGMLDRAISLFKGQREQLLAHMQSVQQRLATLTQQMDSMAVQQRDRIHTLDGLQQANFHYHEQLKGAVQQGQAWLESAKAALALPPDAADPFVAQQRTAATHIVQRLEVAVNDFQNSMTLAKQQALEIQQTQDNARAILDEFERAKTAVIPALTSLLTQQLIEIEQKHALETDDMLRSTLDAAMRQSAQTLGENTIQVATLQQRSLISTTTLDDCQKILEASADKVKQLEEAARQQRIADGQKRAEIEQRLLAQVSK
jgi:uncharacterized protein YaaN involved in tellurite resistance